MIARRALLAACGATAASPRAWGVASQVPGLASLPIPESRSIGFRVMRHGTPIGSHTLEFRVNGDRLDVDIAADVALYLGPIPIVRYTHRATESWDGSRLVALRASTNRNGTLMHASAERVAGRLHVEGSGTDPYDAPEDALPTTYWNARMLLVPMIGTQDGGLVRPRVTPKGVQPVRQVSGAETPAECYSLTGDLDLDLWYDKLNRWMSMRFTVIDGSVISYERL